MSRHPQTTLEYKVDFKNMVGGVTTLDGYVYVAVCGDNFIRVYDANDKKTRSSRTAHWDSRLVVPDLGDKTWGLTSCPSKHYIYVSDFDNNCVHRLTEPEQDTLKSTNGEIKVATKSWCVGNGPVDLSINSAAELVVACRGPSTVEIYSADGEAVRIVRLLATTIKPWHAVELSCNKIAVLYGGDTSIEPGICLFSIGDDNTALLKHVTNVRSVNPPGALAEDNDGFVYVADTNGNQVIVFSRFLCASAPFLGGTFVFRKPRCLHYDKANGRLYVGEDGGRLLVFKNVTDFGNCRVKHLCDGDCTAIDKKRREKVHATDVPAKRRCSRE